MAGEALTTNFVLAAATLMLGPMADLLDLVPATHSLGLVKNVKMKSDPAFKELTQGVLNKVVYSVRTGSQTMISAEVYEYTKRNIEYGLALNAGVNSVPTVTSTTVSTPTTASATTMTVTSATGIVANDWIAIVDATQADKVYHRRVTNVSTNVLTVSPALPAVILPTGTIVRKVTQSAVGDGDIGQQFFSAKIIGNTADGLPVALLFPKVRVTSGLDFTFSTEDFASMPFELTAYDMVPTDPLYATFGNKQGFVTL